MRCQTVQSDLPAPFSPPSVLGHLFYHMGASVEAPLRHPRNPGTEFQSVIKLNKWLPGEIR